MDGGRFVIIGSDGCAVRTRLRVGISASECLTRSFVRVVGVGSAATLWVPNNSIHFLVQEETTNTEEGVSKALCGFDLLCAIPSWYTFFASCAIRWKDKEGVAFACKL